jgi:hypothetical protein
LRRLMAYRVRLCKTRLARHFRLGSRRGNLERFCGTTAKHLELASKFYVLSVLHRLGADATLTFSQSDNIDITVVLESALTVDIKTLSGPLKEWRVADFRARTGHFLAFVWYPGTAGPNTPPDVYIVASKQLETFLANHREDAFRWTRWMKKFMLVRRGSGLPFHPLLNGS